MSQARWDQAVAALGRVLEAHLRNKCETVKEFFLALSDTDRHTR